MAFSMFPLASTSAARQSLKPAPVRSRSSFTSFAGISMPVCCVLILFLFALLKSLFRSRDLQNGPLRAVRSGPHKISTRAVCLALFVVGRNSGFGSLGRLNGSFHNALHEVAFLFLVLFVRTRIDVLDAVHQRLIFGGFLF